jgi:hypothetical protein
MTLNDVTNNLKELFSICLIMLVLQRPGDAFVFRPDLLHAGGESVDSEMCTRLFMVTESCTQSVSEGKLSFTEPLVKFAHRLTGVMGGWANTPDVFGVSASIRTVMKKTFLHEF